jgi:Tol biopolymer transport system component
LALILGNFFYFRKAAPAGHVLRYTIAAPENTTNLHSFAISPDGKLVAMAAEVNGKRQLWLRALDSLQVRPVPGTDEAAYPFWSPDSRYIGFFAQGKLKKIAAGGGPAQSLCEVITGRGGSWNRDNVIVFSPAFSTGVAIRRVSATGGVPSDVTKSRKGYSTFPVFLPDGRHFLYEFRGVSADQNGIYLSSLDGTENRRVMPDVSSVVLAAGRMLFVRENTLMAQPFDSMRGQATGEVFPVAEGISTSFGYAPVTVSETGLLLYESGGEVSRYQMAWYDRGGKLLGTVSSPSQVFDPAISPDEKSILFRRFSDTTQDLWLWDLSRGTEQRLTTDASTNYSTPFWSPTGDRMVFASSHSSTYDLYQKSTSGTGKEELLVTSDNLKQPTQWSHDGRFIVYREDDPKTRRDIWVLPMDGVTKGKPVPFLRSEFNEYEGQLSPDSHWMAYTSEASGQPEVYVRPFPEGEGQTKISIAGGEQPRWRGDRKELFFVAADGKMMAVAVKATAGPRPSFEPGVPEVLFQTKLTRTTNPVFEYDVTADGKRFLLDTIASGLMSAPPLTVEVNWDAGLKK